MSGAFEPRLRTRFRLPLARLAICSGRCRSADIVGMAWAKVKCRWRRDQRMLPVAGERGTAFECLSPPPDATAIVGTTRLDHSNSTRSSYVSGSTRLNAVLQLYKVQFHNRSRSISCFHSGSTHRAGIVIHPKYVGLLPSVRGAPLQS